MKKALDKSQLIYFEGVSDCLCEIVEEIHRVENYLQICRTDKSHEIFQLQEILKKSISCAKSDGMQNLSDWNVRDFICKKMLDGYLTLLYECLKQKKEEVEKLMHSITENR